MKTLRVCVFFSMLFFLLFQCNYTHAMKNFINQEIDQEKDIETETKFDDLNRDRLLLDQVMTLIKKNKELKQAKKKVAKEKDLLVESKQGWLEEREGYIKKIDFLGKEKEKFLQEKEEFLKEKNEWLRLRKIFEEKSKQQGAKGFVEDELEKLEDSTTGEEEISIDDDLQEDSTEDESALRDESDDSPQDDRDEYYQNSELNTFYDPVDPLDLARDVYNSMAAEDIGVAVDKTYCIKLFEKLIQENKMGLHKKSYELHKKKKSFKKKKNGIFENVANFATSETGRSLFSTVFNAVISDNEKLGKEISRITELKDNIEQGKISAVLDKEKAEKRAEKAAGKCVTLECIGRNTILGAFLLVLLTQSIANIVMAIKNDGEIT